METSFEDDLKKQKVKYYMRESTLQPRERVKELLEEYKGVHGNYPLCNESIASGTKIYKELPSVEKEGLGTKRVRPESGFHFYERLGKPLSEVALDLGQFKAKLQNIPAASIEFHHTRGDFANWVADVIENPQLAETLSKVEGSGESLRMRLLRSLDGSDAPSEEAGCPQCSSMVTPAKTWKMAGRPSASGERLQLTIGLYRCPNCDKSFRNVIEKMKIRDT
ncbi:MAG: hypothetical protein JSV35_02480 [Candidatus Bathyarchaeota archaeon]|nr:MAG: hypothetical protein JSV35_02480 [Candidatus Bathyarchaeota archaeon]